MITRDTAAAVWNAYREIEAAEKLLSDIASERERARTSADRHAPKLRDAFGREQDLQLGVPSGENGHRLFNVRPALAESVIRAHIANKQAELAEANERARLELDHAPAISPSPAD